MGKSKHFGKCSLCGYESELSFEHIPPEKAFNNRQTKTISGDKIFGSNRKPWETEGLRYINQQRGFGKYSLCKTCNSNTGAWYGNDYRKFAYGMHSLFTKSELKPSTAIEFDLVKFYPLRAFKQVISMFLSINDGDLDYSLKNFVINRDSNDFDCNKFKIYMYLLCPGNSKFVPCSEMRRFEQKGYVSQVISEIATYPLGYILAIDPNTDFGIKALDISDFSRYKYDEEVSFKMIVPVYECNTLFPVDFRSKNEIEKCASECNKQMKFNKDLIEKSEFSDV